MLSIFKFEKVSLSNGMPDIDLVLEIYLLSTNLIKTNNNFYSRLFYERLLKNILV